jgi:hypothetical protein
MKTNCLLSAIYIKWRIGGKIKLMKRQSFPFVHFMILTKNNILHVKSKYKYSFSSWDNLWFEPKLTRIRRKKLITFSKRK